MPSSFMTNTVRDGSARSPADRHGDRVASIPAVPYPQVLQRRASRRDLNRSAGHHTAARETPALVGHLTGRKQNVTATANSPAQNAESVLENRQVQAPCTAPI